MRIILTWSVPPARFVHNELQLSVKVPDGSPFVGNHRHTAFRPSWSFAGLGHFDVFNMVEIIEAQDQPDGTFRITIFAQDAPGPPQGYALCVVGNIREHLSESS